MMNIRLSGLCVAKPLFGRGLGRPYLGEAFHHLLHQLIGSRAIFNVLFMHMCIVTEFFCEMRESCTIGGPYRINTAFIIFQIEELARLFYIHPIAIFFSFLMQPLFFKLVDSLAKMGRYSFKVGGGKCWRHSLAT